MLYSQRAQPARPARKGNTPRRDGGHHLIFGAGAQAGCSLGVEEIEMTSHPRPPATATLLAQIKRLAKQQSEQSGIPHVQALEDAARGAGYSSWHELQQAGQRHAVVAPSELPLDPDLPSRFDDTPNEDRSARELDTWWDRPFAITRPDGRLEVRCLDGGAWDRSTHYGIADDIAAAARLAAEKLATWRRFRGEPHVLGLEDRTQVVRPPQRPDQEYEVLYEAQQHADASRWLERYRQETETEDRAEGRHPHDKG